MTERQPDITGLRDSLDEVDTGIVRLIAQRAGIIAAIARTKELSPAPIQDADRKMLLEQICHDAIAAKDVKDRRVMPVFRDWLNPAMQDLVEKHAPERLALLNGKTPKVSYVQDGAPYVALRIQDLYGVTQLPRLGLGRVTPLLHILAPSNRPVQITQDLPGFWKEHYPKLKKELQRKYPKHDWRDVP